MRDGDGSGRPRCCCGIDVRADTWKLTNMIITGFREREREREREIWSEKVRCSSKITPKLLSE